MATCANAWPSDHFQTNLVATWFDDEEIVCLRIGELNALLRVGPIDDLEIETDGFAKDKSSVSTPATLRKVRVLVNVPATGVPGCPACQACRGKYRRWVPT